MIKFAWKSRKKMVLKGTYLVFAAFVCCNSTEQHMSEEPEICG